MVAVRLLGGVSATSDAGDPLDIGPAKCQLVLAALALEPGVAVPVSRLVALVWGEDPPRTAERTLQSYVARIRRGLGADTIVRSGDAYLLGCAPESVDVARFDRFVGDGDLPAALAEWSGTPLAGLDAPGLAPAVDRLVEVWLGATEADLERRVRDDPAAAVGALTELSATHPYREGLWALLMTALYRTDRQADALAAFGRARRVLVDELGVEPGPRLRDLEAQILQHHPDLARGRGAGPPDQQGSEPPAAVAATGSTLPRQLVSLVGRRAELGELDDALRTCRLVTLTGPGGVGKTSLAIAVAHQQAADGATVRFVDLSVVPRDGAVARAVIEALGAPDDETDALTSAVRTIDQSGDVLLVLDNGEHVVGRVATFVTAVLDRCPTATVLLTSREPLDLVDERRVEVPPLPPGDAIELFRARAAMSPDDEVAVAALCRRLDGVPLAIELAAARTRTLSPSQLLERIGVDLRVLDARTRGRPARHRSLQASVAWSYELLDDDERTVFRRLSVFPGWFDLDAAEAVATDEHRSSIDVDDLLDRLVRQSMVTVDSRPAGARRGGLRFRLLTPMRELGARDLDQLDEADAVECRHTEWCRREMEAAGHLLAGTGEIAGVALLDERWPDLRAAVDRASRAGDGSLLRALIEPVAGEVLLRSRSEIGDWAERVLELADGDEDLIVFGLTWTARRNLRHRDVDGYRRLLRRYGRPDHPLVRHADALVVEDHEQLVDLCVEAADHLHAAGNPYLAAQLEVGIGRALLALGRLDEHDEVVGALVERFRTDGPPTLLHWTLAMLGYSKLRQHRRDEADVLFAESAAVEIPPGTHSRSGAVAAGVAARHGERRRAFAILRDHAAHLLERRDLYEARLLCLDVINLLVAADRRSDAARLVGFVESTGLLDNPAFATLVRDAITTIERSLDDHAARRAAGRRLDDAAALDLVHAVAAQLAEDARP